HLAYIGHEVSAEADAVSAVKAVSDLGAAWVKVMVTGGRMTPATDPLAVEFPENLLRLVVRHAHDRGLRVAAHALSVEGVRAAARAGVNTVEHGTMIERSGPLSEVPEDIIDEFLANDITLSPTLVDRNFHHPVPLALRATWISQFWSKGVRVVAGGDTGIPGVPHGSLASVVHVLCGAIPAADAIASATVVPGRLMGVDHAEIKVGATPTLLALPGDPRLNPDHLMKAQCLSIRGLPLDPATSRDATPGGYW
ncbi:MAG: amidohydrolase family protein, partial [Nocardioides sp.]